MGKLYLVASQSPYSGGMRAQDGVTVFASTDAGEHDVFTLAGLPMRGALLLIARELDARPDPWYIDVISSPTTIYGDLQGNRWQAGRDGSGMFAVAPEPRLLGAIGRTDLLRERA